MKYLKKFNEHYDNADLRAHFEIPELTGELDFKEMSKDSNIVTDKNPDKYGKTLLMLVMDIPFLDKFDASKFDNILTLFKKFEKVYNENEKTIAIFVVSIDVNDDQSYVLHMEAKVFGYVNGKETELYSDTYNHQLMNSIDELIGVFRSTILYKIKEWSDNVKRYIGEDFMEVDVEQHRINLRYN